MNVIKLKIDFTNRIINQEGVYLVEGDYNSTKLVFEFDKEYEGTKIFEMAKPNTMQAIFVSEIIDNEVVLVTQDENGNNASIFTESGKYIYEISLYDGDSKLTSISGTLPVAKEMVKIDDTEVERYLPVFDQLMQELNTATEAANVAIEEANNLDIDVEKVDDVATVIITKKDGTQKSVEIYDGQGGSGGTGDYEDLDNKPSINDVELFGNKSLQDLGIQPEGNYATEDDIPTNMSELTNDMNFQTGEDVATTVGTETTNRENADINLQSQIDALANANDVVDVLATYQDLLDYDTTDLKNNDIIKVMTDSTHSNAISYFKWVITENVGAWSYVGSQGPFYTKSETDTLLNAKANTSDIPTELADLTDDSTHRLVTDTEKSTWNGKQDALVSGTNIKTVGGQSILGSGDLQVGGDCHVLGTTRDFPTTNRININNMKKGVYLFPYASGSGTPKICFECKYNDITSNLDLSVDALGGSICNLQIIEPLTDELAVGTIFATLEFLNSSSNDGRIIYKYISFKTASNGVITNVATQGMVNYVTSNQPQTVNGKKTFSTLPESSVVPTTDNQLVNKKYVDDTVGDINTALENIINGGVE